MDNKDKLIGVGILLAVGLLVLGIFFPPTNGGNITKERERVIILQERIKVAEGQIKALKKQGYLDSIGYAKSREMANSASNTVEVIKVVYRDAVQATDLRPDSTNLLNEVQVSRKIIVAQTAHINALLDLNTKADKLIASQVEIIKGQDNQITLLSEQLDNMVALNKAELKQERRKGNRKFFKGMGVGAVIVAVLVIL